MYERNDIFDCLIGMASIGLLDEDTEKLNSIDVSEVEITPEFNKRVLRTIRKSVKSRKKTGAKLVLSRIAVAALIMLSTVAILLLSVTAFREAIWGVIVEWREDHIEVRFDPDAENESEQNEDGEKSGDNGGEAAPDSTTSSTTAATTAPKAPPTEILEYRAPTALPEGIEADEVMKNKAIYMVDYYIGDEWYCSYTQSVFTDNDQNYDDTNATVKYITIDNREAVVLLYEDNSQNSIVWFDGEYCYNIIAPLDENGLKALASSIK